MQSGFFKLNLQDFIKGIMVAVLAAIGTALVPILQSGVLPTNPQLLAAGATALAAGGAYLFKNLFTNSDGQVAKSEQ